MMRNSTKGESKMKSYRVEWHIDIDAENPEDAARSGRINATLAGRATL